MSMFPDATITLQEFSKSMSRRRHDEAPPLPETFEEFQDMMESYPRYRFIV